MQLSATPRNLSHDSSHKGPNVYDCCTLDPRGVGRGLGFSKQNTYREPEAYVGSMGGWYRRPFCRYNFVGAVRSNSHLEVQYLRRGRIRSCAMPMRHCPITARRSVSIVRATVGEFVGGLLVPFCVVMSRRSVGIGFCQYPKQHRSILHQDHYLTPLRPES